MKCPKCGAEVAAEEAAFCEECGAKLAEGGAAEADRRPHAKAPPSPAAAPALPGRGGDAPQAERGSEREHSRAEGAFVSPEARRNIRGTRTGSANDAEPEHVPPGPKIDTRRASPPRSGPPIPAGEAQAPQAATARRPASSCPLRLEYNRGKEYVEGGTGQIEMRVRNVGPALLDSVVVDVTVDFVMEGCHSRKSDRGEPEISQLRADGRSHGLHASFRFPEGTYGELDAAFVATVETSEGPQVYRNAEPASILVLRAAQAPSKMQLVFGDNFGRAQAGDIKIAANVGGEAGAGTILRHARQREAEWCEVELCLDEARTAEARKKLQRLSRRHPPGEALRRLRLDISGAGGRHATRRVLLVAKEEVTFGRSRHVCDVSLVLLPLTPGNVRASTAISGRRHKSTGSGTPHMALRLAGGGVELLDHSSNGTYVDGRRVGEGRGAALGRASRVNLAEVLDLRMRVLGIGEEFDAADRAPLVLGATGATGGAGAASGGLYGQALRAGVAAVSIAREGNFPDEAYLVLYAGACVGSSGDAAIPLPGSGLAPRHLLILHLGDGFYVENVSGLEGARLNRAALEPGKIEPLGPRNRIEASGVTIEAADFKQLRPEE